MLNAQTPVTQEWLDDWLPFWEYVRARIERNLSAAISDYIKEDAEKHAQEILYGDGSGEKPVGILYCTAKSVPAKRSD